MAVIKYLDNDKWNQVDELTLSFNISKQSTDFELPTAKTVYKYGLTRQTKNNLVNEITKDSSAQQLPSARAVYKLFTGV